MNLSADLTRWDLCTGSAVLAFHAVAAGEDAATCGLGTRLAGHVHASMEHVEGRA